MTLNLPEVARAVGAPGQPPPLAVSGWSVDTRTQNRGDVYFALRGPHHDGHSFLRAAMEKGAAAVVVDRAGGDIGEPLPDGVPSGRPRRVVRAASLQFERIMRECGNLGRNFVSD